MKRDLSTLYIYLLDRDRLECVALPEFVDLRKQHSAVESAINALEVHGLDKCLDHGINGFKRYIVMAVVARNIQRLGVRCCVSRKTRRPNENADLTRKQPEISRLIWLQRRRESSAQ